MAFFKRITTFILPPSRIPGGKTAGVKGGVKFFSQGLIPREKVGGFIKSHKGPPRFFGSGIVLLLAMAASIVVGYRALEVTLKERSINSEVRLLQEQIAKLREENASLQESIGRAHSKEEVERTAKAELNLQKPGEKVAVVVLSATHTPSAEPKPKTFWERLGSIILFWSK